MKIKNPILLVNGIKKITHPSLRRSILSMVRADQAMRRGGVYRPAIDLSNTRRLKMIITHHGWPLISMVGKSGARGSWLLAQHADRDVLFQEKCLKLLNIAVRHGEAEKKYVAYLTDRVLVNKKRPQLFGTQFYLNKQHEMVPRRITNPASLNKRRKIFDLGIFAAYQKKLLALNKKISPKSNTRHSKVRFK